MSARSELTTRAYNLITQDEMTPEDVQQTVEMLWDWAVEHSARVADSYDPVEAALAATHAPGDIGRAIRERLRGPRSGSDRTSDE